MPKPYTPNDRWSRKAKEAGYRARSVFKLMELDERLKLLKPGMTVIDIGAAPGSWSQYAAEKIGPKGKVIALDLQEIEPIAENVHLHQADITDAAAIDRVMKEEGTDHVDAVLSDIAPSTSGIKDVDQWRSIELSQAAEAIAKRFLRKKGYCILKVFRGADFDAFLRDLKNAWSRVSLMHPSASRNRSKEIYVVLQK